ncbi:heavy metal-responsive transcriptional regulator [Mycobacteroides stephanolepidis]|uniref:Heavy metal-responsive transcriptional regulator n=1 Tax=[Mycobacterium] stephanolepidis TaxID=1520670 RepID=A0A1Z4EXZ7_9MYCO|nr:heavy metal-responsive transcriptional regulator [[Mycobacterium] stephanolepidis]
MNRLTLTQVTQILDTRDHGQPPCTHVRDLLDTRLADLNKQINALLALRDTITRLRQDAETLDPHSCSPNEVCRYLQPAEVRSIWPQKRPSRLPRGLSD